MKIHIDANVQCGSEICGKVSCVIVDPQSEELTHIVVKDRSFPAPPIERLVTVEHIVSSDESTVLLDCTKDELLNMQNFLGHEFVTRGESEQGFGSDQLREPHPLIEQVDRERVPSGELAVHSGASVFVDGDAVGTVDDFVIDSVEDAHITHIVLLEGHLWGKKKVTIPVTEIREIKEDGIHLGLSREEVESLPSEKARSWFA